MKRTALLMVFLALITFAIANQGVANQNGWPSVGNGGWPYRLPSRWFVHWYGGRLWGWDRYYRKWQPICFSHNGKCINT
ncbi:unnamed protein product [Rotaria sp. Silwood1]|nr:unnamed protein product [Rotaria sp. Silwood1]CAF3491185.1 unnamed protein product [Rotaria sp. Silwood1]CAF3547098.1 unnamed protein product [Rotaria sp. Silwood1]CAF3547154.1 unnamed protein product [Rotaria sp. Silwood1]CAF4496483.1 unnamed protein product [Rotaria sp. Silwood1]